MRESSSVCRSSSLLAHISNVLLYLRKKILRGALTNGHDWIFLIVKLDDNYDGASYQQTSMVQLPTVGSLTTFGNQPEPDLIAGILAHWVSLMLILCMIKLLIDWDARLKTAL